MGAEKLTSTITGVEMFRKILDRGEAGDNVGFFKRYSKEDIKEEWLFVSQVQAHATFKAEVYILKKRRWSSYTVP
jgi:elongation factor Tu